MTMNRIGILDKKIITKPCHCSHITNIKHHYSLQFGMCTESMWQNYRNINFKQNLL